MNKLLNIVWILIFFLSGVNAQQQVPYGSNPKAGHYAHVNDIQLYFETYGNGKPVVLLHGNGGSIASFYKLIPYLAKHYKVIAVDSRAQGRSEDSEKELTFEQIASDVDELLNQMHLDSVYIFGWSDGGIVGLQMAYSSPGKISKLAASGANFAADSTALSAEDFDTTKITWFRELSESDKQNVVKHSHFPDRAGLIYDKLINLDLKYPNFSLQQLNSIQTPTLVIAGDHDIIKDTHTLALFHALPHSELFIVPHSHHSVPIERAELLSNVLIEFFDSPFVDMK
jgi:pimeloyl-ACP methyl ester carboxylesterase